MEIDRAARISALLQHPAWPELKAAIDEKAASYEKALLAGLMATGTLPDDFEYKRGYLEGMRAVVRQPDTAWKIIERDVKKHREAELV